MWCRLDYLATEIKDRVVEETAVAGNTFPPAVGGSSKLRATAVLGQDELCGKR
ncbi:MAG: hypothetical protein H6654_04275 [Ardenticatenaceae bacterium]|nr:hypothetical protein [Ardenticatenaceae bacterium]MCB8972751.1 hypothetical protein [Ardenticatenaceae bacterium]